MTFKERLKGFLERHAPSIRYAYTSYLYWRIWAPRCREFQGRIQGQLFPSGKIEVLSGPFSGMAYINEVVYGPITPKWIGAYECELHRVIQGIIDRPRHPVILDIGAAEGYYSVGLALRCPKARVISYDIDFRARRQQRRIAALNGVSNLEVRSLCSAEELERECRGGALVICDIEGGEYGLIDPAVAPALRGCDILLELHDSRVANMRDGRAMMTDRFGGSHRIELIESQEVHQVAAGSPAASRLSERDLAAALDESRGGRQWWLWMEAVPARASQGAS